MAKRLSFAPSSVVIPQLQDKPPPCLRQDTMAFAGSAVAKPAEFGSVVPRDPTPIDLDDDVAYGEASRRGRAVEGYVQNLKALLLRLQRCA